jgi:hypothetical protein
VKIPHLGNGSVGAPITRGGISVFPVYLGESNLPPISTGPTAGLIIDEVPGGEVPHLVVTNPTDRAILIVEGEQLVGGLQNRSPNVSVLVPAGERLEIPVSCLEHGRWGRHDSFRRGATHTPRRVRRTKNREVAKTMATSGVRSGNQGAVWNAVHQELRYMDVASGTDAIADADVVFERDPDRYSAVEELASMGPLPGQCGIVISHGHRVVGAEVFGALDLLAVHWEALIRSGFLELPTAEGRPSATSALKLLRRFSTAEATRSPGIGLGTEHHVATDQVSGQALILGDSVVHAGIFVR